MTPKFARLEFELFTRPSFLTGKIKNPVRIGNEINRTKIATLMYLPAELPARYDPFAGIYYL